MCSLCRLWFLAILCETTPLCISNVVRIYSHRPLSNLALIVVAHDLKYAPNVLAK